MKKRLLITSIVMMLVVAVALSTATYAWFTSNTKVEASNISLTAATSTGAAFGIAWTNENYGTSLTSVTAPVANSFKPLVPATYTTSGASQTESTVVFATATIRQEGGQEKYNTDVVSWTSSGSDTAAKPYIWNNGTQNSFYIKNLSTSNGQEHLYVYADVTGASDLVRIAIFDTDKLIGILGYQYTYTSAASAESYSSTTAYYKVVNGIYIPDTTVTADNFSTKKASLYTRGTTPAVADTYYGTVTANANVLTTKANSSLSIDLGRFDASEAREIKVYVWLDGHFLNDDTQGTAANIDLHFDVTDPHAGV